MMIPGLSHTEKLHNKRPGNQRMNYPWSPGFPIRHIGFGSVPDRAVHTETQPLSKVFFSAGISRFAHNESYIISVFPPAPVLLPVLPARDLPADRVRASWSAHREILPQSIGCPPLLHSKINAAVAGFQPSARLPVFLPKLRPGWLLYDIDG